MKSIACAVAVLGCLMSASRTEAQTPATLPASTAPPLLREIGFEQRLNATAPLDLHFRDDHGQDHALSGYFGNRPVVLALVYFSCPMLCPQSLHNLTESVAALPLQPGRDFDVLAVSFDPRDTPKTAASQRAMLFPQGGSTGWHFLTGDEPAIRALTSAVGFKYVWDDSLNQFAHPAGLTILTPDARIARYVFGLDYKPLDLRLAVVDASARKIASATNAVLLYCYHYEPKTGRYGLFVMRLVRTAGALTVLTIGAVITVLVRRERRGQR
jgi:protein SCO1/2